MIFPAKSNLLLAASTFAQPSSISTSAGTAESAQAMVTSAPNASTAAKACALAPLFRPRATLQDMAIKTRLPQGAHAHATHIVVTRTETPEPTQTQATQPKMYPAAPGLEEAFAYACLQDPGSYTFANELLKKMDTLIGKMLGQTEFDDSSEAPQLRHKIRTLMLPILQGQDAEQEVRAKAEKDRANNEVQALRQGLHKRYAEVYGEAPREIGTSGYDALRIKEVISANSPEEGVQLREKMALIHHIMEWLPHEMQKRAGVPSFESFAEINAAHASMTDVDRQIRRDKLRDYVKSLQLPFPVAADRVADFCQWFLNSDTVRGFHNRKDGEFTPGGRKMNSLFFEDRENLRDILDRSPWKQRPLEANRTINLAMADPKFSDFLNNGTLHQYQPAYAQVRSDLINGTCYFVLNEQRDWYQKNFQNENLMMQTGPSGTQDVLQRLADIFEMPVEMKINGVKAAIAHMHLDDHHSLHEVLSATDGNEELNTLLRYDGTLSSVQRLDPKTFAIAQALQAQFLPMEIEKRNCLERHRNAAFHTEGDDLSSEESPDSAGDL